MLSKQISRIRNVAFALVSVFCLCGADWRQFRGNNADGIAPDDTAPTKWSATENVAWKTELPGRGLSGPIIVGNRVIVSASSGHDQDRLHVLCFDAATGKSLWHRQFWATGRTMCHPKMCNATPNPASDGERVFAFFSSNDVICLDLDGNLQWFRGITYDYPNASNSLGMASSPIVLDDTLILQVESDAEAFAVGLDTSNGLERWKIERPQAANWTSPIVIPAAVGQPTLALLQSSKGLAAIEPRSGQLIWNYDEGASTIPSSVASEGVVYIPSNGITAIRPVESSDAPEMLWREAKLGPSTPSPIVLDGRVYTLNGANVLLAANVADGKLAWRLRLKGPFTSTPIAAGGHLYFFNESGVCQVVKPSADKGEIVGENDIAETILCTPAIANGALYVRSDQHLWKLATK